MTYDDLIVEHEATDELVGQEIGGQVERDIRRGLYEAGNLLVLGFTHKGKHAIVAVCLDLDALVRGLNEGTGHWQQTLTGDDATTEAE